MTDSTKGHGSRLFYRRSHFVTHLPKDHLYSPSHGWMAKTDDGVWRVGLTQFAVRMLGEMVDHDFEIAPNTAVNAGQVIGWIEGFKAISDVFCFTKGDFLGGNPQLEEQIELINQAPYAQGWLYRVRGQPDSKCMDVYSYRDLLDKTIDKMLEKQQTEEAGSS